MISSSGATKSKLTKHIRFGHVAFQDMPIELGQDPPTQGGAPITIGWEPIGVREVPIDVYEICKRDEPIRSEAELKIDVTERAEMLLRAGYSILEIAQASEDASKLLKQRQETISLQKMEFFHLARESAQKKISHALGGRRKLLNPAAWDFCHFSFEFCNRKDIWGWFTNVVAGMRNLAFIGRCVIDHGAISLIW